MPSVYMNSTKFLRVPQTAAVALLVLFTVVGQACAGGDSTLFDAARGRSTAVNSAVMTTTFVLQFFGQSVRIGQVAHLLGAGRGWENPVPERRVFSLLKSRGLAVQHANARSFADVAALLKGRVGPHVAIVALGLRQMGVVGQIGPHYLTVTACGPKGLYIADPGVYNGWLRLDYLKKHLSPLMSPGCLLVRGHIYPISREQAVFIDLGSIPPGPGNLRVTLRVRNTLGTSTNIATTRGTCDCFKFARLDQPHELGPGRTGTLELDFSRGKIPRGTSEREVLLTFTGQPGKVFTVVVRTDISAAGEASQLNWFPQLIQLGNVKHGSSLGCEELTILVPQSISLATPQVSSKYLRILPIRNLAGKTPQDQYGRMVEHFAVDLSRLPAGAVNQTVTVETTDKYVPNIVIPITGRIEGRAAASRGQKP